MLAALLSSVVATIAVTVRADVCANITLIHGQG
jgi:hypothetical protein